MNTGGNTGYGMDNNFGVGNEFSKIDSEYVGGTNGAHENS
jgi:hypothetical protein